MAGSAFTDESVIRALAPLVAIKVDVDVDGDAAEAWRVRALPTVIFVDEDGNESSRFVGAAPSSKFLESAQAVTAAR